MTLRALRSGPRTRARLAADTLLTKATVSSLVTELAGRGLVRTQAAPRAGGVGRPGQLVELAGERVLGVGLELNVDYLAAVAIDLTGEPRAIRRLAFDGSRPVADTVAEAARLVAYVAASAVGPGGCLAGVGVAAPGLVDLTAGVVRVAPNLHWRDVPLRELLLRRLPAALPRRLASQPGWPPLAVAVDNEANLATLAEYALADGSDRDLVYVTGGVGVGSGIVVDGRVVRGHAGFAGEVGHLAIVPDGEVCGCGRRGCWETLCGLGALLDLAADPTDPVHDHDRDLDERLDLLLARARAGHDRTLRAFDRVARALGHGASMLVNLVNPKVLVLGGYFARLGEFVLRPVEDELTTRVVAPEQGGCRVELSRLGLAAAATGAAYAALQPILDDPALVPPVTPRAPTPKPAIPVAATTASGPTPHPVPTTQRREIG